MYGRHPNHGGLLKSRRAVSALTIPHGARVPFLLWFFGVVPVKAVVDCISSESLKANLRVRVSGHNPCVSSGSLMAYVTNIIYRASGRVDAICQSSADASMALSAKGTQDALSRAGILTVPHIRARGTAVSVLGATLTTSMGLTAGGAVDCAADTSLRVTAAHRASGQARAACVTYLRARRVADGEPERTSMEFGHNIKHVS